MPLNGPPTTTTGLLVITAQHCKQEGFLEEVGQIPAPQTGEPITASGNRVDPGAAGLDWNREGLGEAPGNRYQVFQLSIGADQSPQNIVT